MPQAVVVYHSSYDQIIVAASRLKLLFPVAHVFFLVEPELHNFADDHVPIPIWPPMYGFGGADKGIQRTAVVAQVSLTTVGVSFNPLLMIKKLEHWSNADDIKAIAHRLMFL
jgi:hypothetical protein